MRIQKKADTQRAARWFASDGQSRKRSSQRHGLAMDFHGEEAITELFASGAYQALVALPKVSKAKRSVSAGWC